MLHPIIAIELGSGTTSEVKVSPSNPKAEPVERTSIVSPFTIVPTKKLPLAVIGISLPPTPMMEKVPLPSEKRVDIKTVQS